MMNQRDEVMIEFEAALDQKSSLEKQIAESDRRLRSSTKRYSAVELLQNYKKEREELQMERDNALKEAEELRKSRAPQGILRHTTVAIKLLHSNSLQGQSEFQQEVEVFSKMRHPNMVTLIGACPEAWTLVYEYLPNGSLEDRLSCRENSPPLSWQTRIRIATELCSVLIFLHSSKPHGIVHGDLKPANVLLDSNFVTKLSDFGICRLLSNNTTVCCRTDPKGTFAYMDPEFLSTGELTPKAEVYSFGVILLRLLTRRSAFDLSTDVWRMLEPMRASCGGSSSFQLGSEEHCQPPSYFICPIFQEVMRDPHVAGDGFSLVPNLALRSTIQEWLQQH
ncbi:signal peptide peptidase-like 4-like [Hibiscus syriacus]|uniref:RING-type E3 ubiquitin transferase n=1 Tax=Hibiscus syriacus TaxID=106335 RepID=A0A6A2WPG7_HIBSY|nr:signal peptide peptidase-like 4-like [Hibiscus syriacus]